MARYERLFTRYLLAHFDEQDHHDGNDDPLLAEVAASAVVTAHNHVLRRWLRAGGQGDVEAELDHAFSIVRKTFGSGIGAGRTQNAAAAPAAPHGGPYAGRGTGGGGPYGRPAGRGHADHRGSTEEQAVVTHITAAAPVSGAAAFVCPTCPYSSVTLIDHRSSAQVNRQMRESFGTRCLAE